MDKFIKNVTIQTSDRLSDTDSLAVFQFSGLVNISRGLVTLTSVCNTAEPKFLKPWPVTCGHVKFINKKSVF